MGYDASLRASKHANVELANDLEHTKVSRTYAAQPHSHTAAVRSVVRRPADAPLPQACHDQVFFRRRSSRA